MSQCPPPGKREPLGYTGPEAKGAGRPSPWTTDRQICPPDKLHHDQRKKWGRPCRYHAEGSLPQECPYPSAYRGCASFSFLRHCIILKKAVAFRHRRIPDAKRPHTEKRRAICIDSRRSRPVPQRPETAHRHRARPDGRGRGGGRARRHPARAVAPARSHPTGYFHARTQRRGGHTPYQGGCAGSAHPYRFHARHSRACTRGPESRSRRLPAQNGGRGRVPRRHPGPAQGKEVHQH